MDFIKEELEQIVRNLHELEENYTNELATSPLGSLINNRNDGKPYFYHSYYDENGNWKRIHLSEDDPMLEEAIELAVDSGQISTSALQRRFRLGYARAGRIVDMMEQKGIVGPSEGSKPRKVLITKAQWLERNMMKSDDRTEESL